MLNKSFPAISLSGNQNLVRVRRYQRPAVVAGLPKIRLLHDVIQLLVHAVLNTHPSA